MQKARILLFLIIVFLISVLLVSLAYAKSWYQIRTPEQMRSIYFGSEYMKPLSGWGLKDITEGYLGFKGATSLTQNLPYNAYISRGRDPQHISNWDPRMRGYTIMNEYVELEPVESKFIAKQGTQFLPGMTAGNARIISNREDGSDMYKTNIYLQMRDLIGIGVTEVYEAWLVDEDTNYPLTIGIFAPATYGGLTSLNFVDFPHYIYNYDYIMVTKEPFPDSDPNPGEVVLLGKIPQVRKATQDVSAMSYYGK
ncbi:MAG: hypothetical protein QW666_00400 [Candidatus Woesearchaeota archaeon]